jgi:outer membrane protein assembly factor BamA
MGWDLSGCRAAARVGCLGVGVAVAGACAARRVPPPPPGSEAVARVRFDGNADGKNGSAFEVFSGTSDYSLRSAMEQGQSPRFSWLVKPRQRRVLLDRDTLELDAWRIETWYAHHGYFDARVLSWDVRTLRPARAWGPFQRPAIVEVRGDVQSGPPSTVASLEWVGIESVGRPLLALIRESAPIQQGERFDIDALREAEALTLSTLLERGFAFATVRSEIEARPNERAVAVRIIGDPGPSCRFGPVRVTGALPVRKELVLEQIELEEGSPFRMSTLQATQRRLFGLGVFSVVNVVPELSAAAGDIVPVRVDLAPSKPRQLRLGAGLLFESGKQDIHASAEFQHLNILRELVRLDLQTRGGYTTVIQLANVEDVSAAGLVEATSTAGPTALVRAALNVPRLPAPGWESGLELSFEQGVEQGYRFRTPEVSPGIKGRLGEAWSAELSYRLRFFDYLDLALDESDFRRTPLGLDFSDPYLLSYLRQRVTFDTRDDLLFTRDGAWVSYEVNEAGGPFGGGFNFVKGWADHRAYLPVRELFGWRPRGTVAGRLAGGFIQPYGAPDRARVPYAERLYLGGSTDVRGWPRRLLGPYICDPDSGVDCAFRVGAAPPVADPVLLPVGGLVAAFGSLEARAYIQDEYGFAVFTDAGMVWESVEAMSPFRVLPTVGAGARYRSPIGPIRLDLAWRVADPPEFSTLPRLGVHFSLSEAF